MDAPLAPHLPRFSSLHPLLPPPLDAFDEEAMLTMPEPDLELEVEPSVTMAVAVYEAHLLEAVEAVCRDLEAEHAASRDEAEARHADALVAAIADAETARAAEDGAAIAGQIVASFEAMRDANSQDVAQALRPLFDETIVARTVAAAAEAIAAAIADPDHPSLTLRGPVSLLAAIETALGDVTGVELVATDESEVTVSANAIRMETRLAQALTALADGDA